MYCSWGQVVQGNDNKRFLAKKRKLICFHAPLYSWRTPAVSSSSSFLLSCSSIINRSICWLYLSQELYCQGKVKSSLPLSLWINKERQQRERVIKFLLSTRIVWVVIQLWSLVSPCEELHSFCNFRSRWLQLLQLCLVNQLHHLSVSQRAFVLFHLHSVQGLVLGSVLMVTGGYISCEELDSNWQVLCLVTT